MKYLMHRWFYEHLRGPIPRRRHLHHHCQTKRCVNPAHLSPLSPTAHGNLTWRAMKGASTHSHPFIAGPAGKGNLTHA